MALMSKNLESEFRRFVEIALQSGCGTEYAGEHAGMMLYDGGQDCDPDAAAEYRRLLESDSKALRAEGDAISAEYEGESESNEDWA